jgi:hypothetical protein
MCRKKTAAAAAAAAAGAAAAAAYVAVEPEHNYAAHMEIKV